MKTRTLILATAVAFLCAAAGAAGGTPSRPLASSFSPHVDNPWFPLIPGTRYVYTGVKDGKRSRDVVTVMHGTTTIDGVACVAVRDLLYLRGRLEERTTDWYSQDSKGNVWYFGENTAELDRHGRVTSTEGTWRTGVHAAKAGIYMPAHPRVGQTGRQEFLKGHAEDHFKVVGRFGTVVGPGAKPMLLTQETTPLEPGVIDHKFYVRGIGTVLEQTEKGGNERNELVSVTRG
jgi:hypothetical protein